MWQSDLAKLVDSLHLLLDQDISPFLDSNETNRSPFFRYRSDVINLLDTASRSNKALIEGYSQLEYGILD